MLYSLLILGLTLLVLNKMSQQAKQKWMQIGVLLTAVLALWLYNLAILKVCPGDCAIRVDLVLAAPLVIAFCIAVIYRMLRRG